MAWPDRRILDLFGIELPIIQAPMAGFGTPEMAIAAAQAGGLGSLACASLERRSDPRRESRRSARRHRGRSTSISSATRRRPPMRGREAAWRARLAPYYVEMGLDPERQLPARGAPALR